MNAKFRRENALTETQNLPLKQSLKRTYLQEYDTGPQENLSSSKSATILCLLRPLSDPR